MAEVTNNRIEREERLTQVAAWLSAHHTYGEVVRLDATTHGVSESTAKRDIAAVYADNGKSQSARRAENMGEAENDLRRWKAKAEAEGDTRLALACHEGLAKLLGLNAPLQLEDVTDKERPMQDWPDSKLSSKLAELKGNGGVTAH